ncbi:MAG: DUF2505 family protein [Acidimicrobiales bacterium]
MRFHAEHRFDAPVPAVAALLADPAFYLGLDLPDLSTPEMLETRTDGSETTLRLRYEYRGHLDPIVLRLLGSNHLAWMQEVRIDRSTDSGTLHFEAERDPKRLHGTADFVLAATGKGAVRRLDGELAVAVPGIGRMAERRIVPGILNRLDIEARALGDRLRSGA